MVACKGGRRRWEGRVKKACVSLGLTVLPSLLCAVPLKCQEVLPPEEQAEANRLFDQNLRSDPLKCTIDRERTSLDFTFHFDTGFVITCPFQEFGGRRTLLTIYVRVTPVGGTPVLLKTLRIIRGLSIKPSQVYPGKGKAYFVVRGGFSVGEGRYRVEVLMQDPRKRTCRRAWWIKIPHHAQRSVPMVLAPNHVSSLHIPTWRGPQPGGLHLAVLLSAGSFNPRATRLGVGYQMMLLQILSTLLQQIPCSSVRLVAFNLDQERVIYQTDSFRPSGFAELQESFNGLNLGVVSVETLKRRNDWAQMLATLTNRQLTAQPPPDAVIILGRSYRWMKRVPREMLMFRYEGMPRFYYFENGPENLFPDSLGFLTKSLGGKIYRITTPHDLGTAIQKMLAQLRGPEPTVTASKSRQGE
jgi:hypothetical protein